MKTLKCRTNFIVAFVVAGFLAICASTGHAFNLVTDVQQNTQWTLGQSVDAGTAVTLRRADAYNVVGGQWVGSALASIANYRFLNLAAGGTFFPQSNGNLRAVDTAKLGLNLGYFLNGFVNQPPTLLKNLVVGPSFAMSMVSTPHVLVPMVDLNYQFSK